MCAIRRFSAFIGSWLTPTVTAWRKARKERSKLGYYHNKVKKLYTDGKLDMILITAKEWTGRFVMNVSNLPIYRIINIIHHLLLNMKVEIELYIHEDDETAVMQKVSALIKQ
jgi:hypothetical protein